MLNVILVELQFLFLHIVFHFCDQLDVCEHHFILFQALLLSFLDFAVLMIEDFLLFRFYCVHVVIERKILEIAFLLDIIVRVFLVEGEVWFGGGDVFGISC